MSNCGAAIDASSVGTSIEESRGCENKIETLRKVTSLNAS